MAETSKNPRQLQGERLNAWTPNSHPRLIKSDAPRVEPGLVIFSNLPRLVVLKFWPASTSPAKPVGDCWVPLLEFMIE